MNGAEANERVERDIFIGSRVGVGASRFVISTFPEARKGKWQRDRKFVRGNKDMVL